jgi:acyl-CoA thioesterase FadM
MAYYDVDQMGVAERAEFLEWYEGQKSELFDNKRVL